MCAFISVCLSACLCSYHWECSCIFLCVCAPRFPNRAPVRAVTAYLQKHPTGLAYCSVENIPKPLVGVNSWRAFHKLTSLHRSRISSRGLLHYRSDEICSFNQTMLFIHTYNCGGVLWRGDTCREISHSSQSELRLYKYGSARSMCLMRLREAVVSAGRGAGLLMPLSSSAGLISGCLLRDEVCSLTSSPGDSRVWITFPIPPCWHCS